MKEEKKDIEEGSRKSGDQGGMGGKERGVRQTDSDERQETTLLKLLFD